MKPRDRLRFVLLQARNAHDPVRSEERDCFVRRLGIDDAQLHCVDILTEHLDERLHERFDALLVGGSGDYSVLDDEPAIRRFVDFLGATEEAGFPTFASCFGFQAVALALGGEVQRDEARGEVGTYELELTDAGKADPLFGALPPAFLAQEGHKDHVTRLPHDLVPLARSARSPNQALKATGKPMWATQFHPELTGDDNKKRVLRYWDRYAEEGKDVLASMQPSPDVDPLLSRFVDRLAAGELDDDLG